MSESPAQFELVEFEQLEAAPGTVLLRIAARPSRATGSGPLTLVIHDGQREYRHPQLPGLPGPPGLIRAAFSAPLDHIGRGTMFALELPDRSTVRLPAPSRRRPTAGGVTDAQGLNAAADSAGAESASVQRRARAKEVESSRLAEAERRAEARRLAITELERRLRVERERRQATEADIERMRADLEQAFAERDEAVADRDAAVADRERAEARAVVAAASAGTLDAQIRASTDAAKRAQKTLKADLDEKARELDSVRAAAELAQARAHASRREVAELDEQLAYAQAPITVLEQAITQGRAETERHSAQTDAALAGAQAQVVEAQALLATLQEQLAQLRETAQRAESEHGYDLETAPSRIDSAHAELEVARLEIKTLQERVIEQEATLGELAGVLSTRAAAIELLRLSVDEKAERAAADAISTHEAKHREIKDALRAETERRVRAEEALLAASADRILASESVALEASAREQVEVRAAQLLGERDQLEAQAETLFARIADQHAQADAEQDVLRHLS